jgi:hypothetical protein
VEVVGFVDEALQINSDGFRLPPWTFSGSGGIIGSLARFPYRLKVESGETSKWEVQETGKAPEPPNTKIQGLGTSNFRSFRPPSITASIPQILLQLPNPLPPLLSGELRASLGS